MTKWADYVIVAVRFNQEKTHIDRVKVHIDNGENISASSQEFTRIEVVSKIEKGTTFITSFKPAGGNWNKGKEVFIILINGNKFIKTVRNNIEKDNLDDLPEF